MKLTEPVYCVQPGCASYTGCAAPGEATLRAANSRTSITCSFEMSNHSVISSTVAPASRFSKTAETGIRVSRNTQPPFNRPGTLSTTGHCDQSRFAMVLLLTFILSIAPDRLQTNSAATDATCT